MPTKTLMELPKSVIWEEIKKAPFLEELADEQGVALDFKRIRMTQPRTCSIRTLRAKIYSHDAQRMSVGILTAEISKDKIENIKYNGEFGLFEKPITTSLPCGQTNENLLKYLRN